MSTPHLNVRKASAADAPELLALMRELASFEGYLPQFRVTEQDLLARGLGPGSQQQFFAFVAESGGQLLGYAVAYVVPFTFDLRPNCMLKELFVRGPARGTGAGRALMAAVIDHAVQLDCGRLKWDVLQDNTLAKAFYQSLGAQPDWRWEGWIKTLA